MGDISDPLMEFDDADLMVNDIEASAMSGGISSAKYEEPISAENTKKVIIYDYQLIILDYYQS